MLRFPPTEIVPPGLSVRVPVPEVGLPLLTVRVFTLPATCIPPPSEASKLPPTVKEVAFPPTLSVPPSSATFPVYGDAAASASTAAWLCSLPPCWLCSLSRGWLNSRPRFQGCA